MVKEAVRRMTALFITGLFGLFTTIVGTILEYRLGLKKSRNEQQAEVLIELRRKYPPGVRLAETRQPASTGRLSTICQRVVVW